ncbi:S8 family serine peptidase, partial [Saccharomonospora sp. NB11]|uniref:S8 family serine peptidase n=1 Tax=Saccharomonospora sp. NB11 TaxID=1642298 RepID=UPI0018CFF798
APDAELVVGKVLDDDGFGQESWILAGMEWAAENASVVNMSLGANATDGTDPMSEAVNRLTEETGTLFVVSAGNNGSSEESVGSPGAADAALTVGAVTKDDELADFSSRGPRLGDGAVKPDVTAPGVDIVSAKAAGTEMGAPVGDHYVTASGTSMATPHVAGAAALLAQQHEDWDADELKAALMASARPHDALSVYEQGAGRIDVPGALEQSVLASPASVSLGMVGWPYSDEPVREKVTYTNTSDEPVTLELSGELSGPNGAAPEGMITVEPSQLTVPAGGTAEATVSVDVTIAGSHGAYGGLVLASAGDTTVRTPVGIELEEESYTFQVEALDFDGKAAQEAYVHMARLDGEVSLAEIFTDGTLSLRAPKGEYFMQVVVYEDMTAFGRTADFYEPRVVVDGDSSVTLDARKAQPVSVSLDDLPDAEMGELEVSAIVGTVGGPGVVTGSVDPETMLIAPSQTSHEDFDFTVRTRHARPDGNGGYVGSPYTVHVSNTTEGAVPEDLTYEVSVAELAKVTSVHSDAGAGDVGRRELVTAELPFTLTEYYTPGVEWDTRLELGKTEDFDYVGGLYHSEVFERAGDNGVRTWNTPVFGPAFSPNSVARSENYLWFHPSLHSDPGRGSTGDVWVTGYTELYRDGELLEKFDVAGGGKFNLPSESSEYRLVTEADASELMSVSRLVKAEWTFRSEYADGTVDVPLLAVRFEPDLGEDSVVKAGEKLRIPVRVQRNGDAKEPTLAALQVEASFDGGESWKVVKHKTSRGDRYVTVTAPKGAKDVSLRAVAKDTEGNEVKQTIIGAYLVK